MPAYMEAVVGGVDDICIVKYTRIMEAGNDSFNDLVGSLQSLQPGTVEPVVVGYHSGVKAWKALDP
jgi:hypothetical protein